MAVRCEASMSMVSTDSSANLRKQPSEAKKRSG